MTWQARTSPARQTALPDCRKKLRLCALLRCVQPLLPAWRFVILERPAAVACEAARLTLRAAADGRRSPPRALHAAAAAAAAAPAAAATLVRTHPGGHSVSAQQPHDGAPSPAAAAASPFRKPSSQDRVSGSPAVVGDSQRSGDAIDAMDSQEGGAELWEGGAASGGGAHGGSQGVVECAAPVEEPAGEYEEGAAEARGEDAQEYMEGDDTYF